MPLRPGQHVITVDLSSLFGPAGPLDVPHQCQAILISGRGTTAGSIDVLTPNAPTRSTSSAPCRPPPHPEVARWPAGGSPIATGRRGAAGRCLAGTRRGVRDDPARRSTTTIGWCHRADSRRSRRVPGAHPASVGFAGAEHVAVKAEEVRVGERAQVVAPLADRLGCPAVASLDERADHPDESGAERALLVPDVEQR